MHGSDEHAALMDGIYRRERHIYDLTRPLFLLGRDRLIDELALPPRGTVLEIGCGTGRNLIRMARRHPDARLYGIDISRMMLATAEVSIKRAGLGGRISLAHADAGAFEADQLFGVALFDRVFISYALSMIPSWREALTAACGVLAPDGELHIVDFGRAARLPAVFRHVHRTLLARYAVTPRTELEAELSELAVTSRAVLEIHDLYRGYSTLARLRRVGPT